MTTSGIKFYFLVALFMSQFINDSVAQRFNTNTSTDCGNINIKFGIQGGLDFCEGDTITLTNTTDSTFDYYIIDWSEGKLDSVYNKNPVTHIYYFPDSVLCKAAPLAVYFLGVKNCKGNKQTRVWGAYGINHIYRPLANFEAQLDSVCFGHNICMKSTACNADSVIWNFNNEIITSDSCYAFSTSGTKQITMIAYNKCASDTITKSFTIVDYPSVKVNVSNNIKNNSVCKGDTVTYINASNQWSHTKWTFPPLNDKVWVLDTAISNLEKSQPFDTIIFLDTIRFIVLDTGTIKFRLLSTNPCDSITWDYNLKVVESAIIQFQTPPRFCETADYTPNVNFIGSVDKYNWSFPGGTPSTSLLPNPKNIHYDKPGIYTIILRATNSCGTSTDSIKIYVDAKQTLTIDSVKNPICKSAGLISLHANLPNGNWLGTGVNSLGMFDPSNLPAGTYDIIYSLQSGGCLLSDTLQLMIVDTTALNVLPLTLCVNTLPVQLNANPPGGRFSGPGINSFGEFDPSLTGLGSFTIHYDYIDANSCSSMTTAEVKVERPPQISKKDTLTVCLGITSINLLQDLKLSANPAGGQYSFLLNGKPVNPIINTLNYKAGIYVLLINYKINLCSIQDTAIINLIQAPLLQISNDTILCDREGIFRLQTNQPGGIWSGPAVNPSTGLIDLRAIGSDTAVYTYTFGGGTSCESDQSCTIIIDDKGIGVDAGFDLQFCKDSIRTYQLQGFSPNGGSWSGKGIIDKQSGIIDLDLLASDSIYIYHYCFIKPLRSPCTFCDSIQLIVHSLPEADFEIIGSACLNMNFSLDNKSKNAIQYLWDFGDGIISNQKSPAHIYTDTGLHTLSLIVTNQFGCRSQISKSIDVKANPPVASFTLDSTNGCAPFHLNIRNNSRGDNISYIWSIAGATYTDSLPSITIDGITKDSVFKVELIVQNGCGKVSDSNFITVRPYPQVNFGIDSFEGCTPLELHFSNNSLGNVDLFKWDMGNGQFYNSLNPPKQIYTTNDSTTTTYQIKLIGINECGIDSLVKTISVYPPNVSAFIEVDQTKICQYDSLQLKSYSTPGSHIDWKIIEPSGLINTSNEMQTSFTFEKAGQYTIILHAANCGEDFDTVYIRVLPAPKIDFDLPAILCLNDTAFFINKSSAISASFWNFGDGTSSTATHPSHLFSSPGKYSIQLTGYAIANNCPYTVTKEIVVIGSPEAKFDASTIAGCAPLTVHFFNRSIGATKFSWNFSDNSSNSLMENPIHVFSQAGKYQVILQVLDTNQCFSDTALLNINAYPTPVSEFIVDPKNYCLGKDSVFLKNTSTGAVAYSWTINNLQSSVINPKFLPQDTGVINIQLVSTNVFLCSDTFYQKVQVVPSPLSAFKTDKSDGCEDLEIQFTNLSAFATNYVWDFGEGNTSTIPSPSHLFLNPGHRTISLISIGSNGCPPDTVQHSIDIWPLPDADFVILKDSICGVPMHVQLKNNSQSSSNINWALNGKLISTNTETEYTFDSIGDYQISLHILSEHGCSDSLDKTLSIYEKPIADFALDNEACENAILSLHNYSKLASQYEWFIESLGYSNEFEPKLTFLNAGNYDIQLIAINNSICKDTLLKKGFIKIYEQPIADFDYQIDVDKTISGDVQFTNHSKNYTGQKWYFGDGLFTQLDNPLHVYSANQSFEATLFVFNTNSGLFTCVDSITKSIGPLWITTFYAPNAFSPEYGDGDVKLFKPVGLGIESYEMAIYSPWGERVWYSNTLENNSPSESWDGRYKGILVPQGSYTWIAKLTFINGNKKIEKGTVTVLR